MSLKRDIMIIMRMVIISKINMIELAYISVFFSGLKIRKS